VNRMELSFPAAGVTATVEMHWNAAPRTCAAMWEMLAEPLEGKTNHAVFSGYEFFLYCSPVDLDLENHVAFPKPGQLIYYFLPARRNADNVAHQINLDGHTADAAEVAVWYGEGDLRRMTECGVRGNHFATITDGLEDVFRVGLKLLVDGQTTAVLKRRADS
jgi:hypothetical protein